MMCSTTQISSSTRTPHSSAGMECRNAAYPSICAGPEVNLQISSQVADQIAEQDNARNGHDSLFPD